MLLPVLYSLWGCIPELAQDCQDMTNSSSTYFSIMIGAIIGGIISWWIYNRQKHISEKQDLTLEKIRKINERHDSLLKRIEEIEQHHQKTLDAILRLDKQIAKLIEHDNQRKEL
jgi:uncharacterized membrane protein YgaE (UPF0421/DUF939 family)